LGRACAAVAALSVLVVVPYAMDGPGFLLDDWGDFARIAERGWVLQEGPGKFASRPGAAVVNTVLYGSIGRHPLVWLAVLTAVAAATAAMLVVVLTRFVPLRTAGAVSAIWVLLPNHTSLRVFPNCAPIAISLLGLLVGIHLLGGRRYLVGALVLCAASTCYEAVLLPAIAAVVVLHVWRRWGTRREARLAVGGLVLTGVLMSIHPTYDPFDTPHGTPRYLFGAHFGGGLSDIGWIALALSALAAVGVLLAAARHRDVREHVGSPAWLVAVGIGVMVVGLAAFVLRFPVDVRGVADRNYVVSSVGAALVWWGVLRVVAGWNRVAMAALTGLFVAALAVTNVRYQHDWSVAVHDTVTLVHAVDCRYHGSPPAGLVVGPGMPRWNGVGAINTFFVPAASQVLVGHRMHFRMGTPDEWEGTPPDRRLSWADVLDDGPSSGRSGVRRCR
jgi:hypothetical protein